MDDCRPYIALRSPQQSIIIIKFCFFLNFIEIFISVFKMKIIFFQSVMQAERKFNLNCSYKSLKMNSIKSITYLFICKTVYHLRREHKRVIYDVIF